MNTNKLSIITPTKNCVHLIHGLIDSLNKQSDKSFEWIIVDGGSSDGTIQMIEAECEINFRIIKANDFSIYHATNIALDYVNTEYYAVAGSDDTFEYNFSEKINKLVTLDDYDLIFGSIKAGKKIIKPGVRLGWLKGVHGVGSSHSIGTVIKKKLHLKHGVYSKMFPVVADQYFIKKCVYSRCKILRVDELFGEYAMTGFSSTNKMHYQIDFLKMQLLTENYKMVQVAIFLLRYLKLSIVE